MNIERLEHEADRGSVVAQTVLGVCYLDAVGVAADYTRAFSLLTAAATRGAARAMVNLGRMYQAGLATPRDAQQAATWYRRAAERGEFLGWVCLARLQHAGGEQEEALGSYRHALEGAHGVADCPELTEAREFVSRHND
jgi:hypothetical protein